MTGIDNVFKTAPLALTLALLVAGVPALAAAHTETTGATHAATKSSTQNDTQFLLFPGNPQSVVPGSSVAATVAARAKTGFSGTIELAAANLPSGITASFSPASLTGSGNSQVTFRVGNGVAAGTYLITIDGTTPGATRTAYVTLTVVSAIFSLAESSPTLALAEGTSGNLTLTANAAGTLTNPIKLSASGLPAGVTGSFSPASLSASGHTTLSLSVGASVAVGNYPVTVTGASGATSHQLQFTLQVKQGLSGSGGPPTPTSTAAAVSTAENNSVCKAIEPFYLEVGDKSGARVTASVGVDSSGTPVTATSRLSIASASKWIYGMYVVQKRGGVSGLSAADVAFMHMTSGYTNMPSDTSGATCTQPAAGNDSISYCLTLSGPMGAFNASNSATTGMFDYGSGHQENHAGKFQPELSVLDTSSIGTTIAAEFGMSGAINLDYTQPLLAGGIYASANDYSPVLRAVLSGQLLMHDALGTSPVCAWMGSSCGAAGSPIVTEHWHYSISHWVEDDPSQNNDGAFSSPGAFGFYPWIDATKTYYGVISRYVPTGSGMQNGLASAQCGALVRRAWMTGVPQTGSLPN